MDSDLKKVQVYIDYENIHKIMIKDKTDLMKEHFFDKLYVWALKQGFKILNIHAYSNFDDEEFYPSYHQSRLQEYNINTIHTSNKGKNCSDIQIMIDMLEEIYISSNCDYFIIISSDKDMVPLIKSMKKSEIYIHLITTKRNIDLYMLRFPDKHCYIDEIVECELDEAMVEDIKIRENKVLESLIYLNKSNLETKNTKNRVQHIELDYFIKENSKRLKLFKTEIARILYTNKDKILLYNYVYQGKTCKALVIETLKNDYLNNGFFVESDIEVTEDIINEDYIDSLYKVII